MHPNRSKCRGWGLACPSSVAAMEVHAARVMAEHGLHFAYLDELLAGIGAGGFRQPIDGGWALDVRENKRFRDKVRNRARHVGGGENVTWNDGGGRLAREPSGEHA